jgi:hypothetical protein
MEIYFSPLREKKLFLHVLVKEWFKFNDFKGQVFEFVPLLDEKVQGKFLENFSGGPK